MTHNNHKRKVIAVTDGDTVAQAVIESIAPTLGLRCISASGGNPTPLDGKTLVQLALAAPYDPVIIMFDDRGCEGKGDGELALEYVLHHPAIEVIAVLAVAANTAMSQGVAVDVSVTADGEVVHFAIDKAGKPIKNSRYVHGDTVDVVAAASVPLVVGIGDIGKMEYKDALQYGAPVTKRALELILQECDGRRLSDETV